MYNYQKIAKVIIKNFPKGKVLSNSEIVETVLSKSDVVKGSILPADYCIDKTGVDPHVGRYHIFEKLEEKGLYKVLNHEVILKSVNKKDIELNNKR